MDNVVQLKTVTDEAVERAIHTLTALTVTELENLPDNVKGALQQLALKLLRATI